MPISSKLARLNRRRYATIPVPISAKTRVASISRNKIEVGCFRRFSTAACMEIESFQPQVLIGSMADLQPLAALSDDGTVDLSSVDTAILVATEVNGSLLNDVERVVLWQAFGVPVYELLVSMDLHLVGSECEAHSGWHMEPRMQRQYRRFQLGAMATDPCECGRKEPRIIAQSDSQLARALAAIA